MILSKAGYKIPRLEGLGIFTRIVENPMEKKMENQMQTGTVQGLHSQARK